MDQNDELIAPAKAKETMSLVSVFLLLGFIFALIAGTLFFLRFSSYSSIATRYLKKTAVFNLHDYFAQNVVKAAIGDQVEIRIDEGKLADALGVSNTTFPLKKAKLAIKPEGVVLTGKISGGFFGLPAEVTVMPKALDGEIVFEVASIKAAGVPAPPKIVDVLQPAISSAFANLSLSKGEIKVTEVRPMLSYLLIEGERIK